MEINDYIHVKAKVGNLLAKKVAVQVQSDLTVEDIEAKIKAGPNSKSQRKTNIGK